MKWAFLFFCVGFSLVVHGNFLTDAYLSYQGYKAYSRSDFDQAGLAYTKLLQQDPYNSMANYNMGLVLYRQKKYDVASHYFDRAANHAKNNIKLKQQALFNQGNSYVEQKKLYEAIGAYSKVLEINSKNDQARHNLEYVKQMLQEQQKNDQQDQKTNEKQSSDNSSENQKNRDQRDQQKRDKQTDQNQNKNESSSKDQKNQKTDQSQLSQNDKQDQQNSSQKSDDATTGNDDNQQSNKEEKSKDEQTKEEVADQLQKSNKSTDQKNQQQQENQSEKKSNQKESAASKESLEKSSNQSQKGLEKSEAQSEKTSKNIKDDSQTAVALQDAYANEMLQKPESDQRLDKRAVLVMQKLQEQEDFMQKQLLKMNVSKQGAFGYGQKNW